MKNAFSPTEANDRVRGRLPGEARAHPEKRRATAWVRLRGVLPARDRLAQLREFYHPVC